MSSPSVGEPEGNPAIAAYERWSAATPFVTRTTMLTVVIAYIVSWFIDMEMALGNIPYYTVMNFEVYRIFLSFLVGNSILSVIMIALFFPSMAGRMENSLGSSGVLVLMASVAILTNVAFDLLCVIMSYMGSAEALFWPCDNFWVIVFGLITIECMQIPDAPRRMLFIPVDIPSKYFPLVLYGFFCLFSGLMLSYFLSIVIGYCYAMGYMDKLKISDSALGQSESNGCLSSFSRRVGWVPIGSALGHQAWSPQGQQQQGGQGAGITSTRGGPRVFGYGGDDVESGQGDKKAETQPLMEQFPGSGRTLASGSGGRGSASKASREQIAAQRLNALGMSSGSATPAPSAPPMSQNSDVKKLVDMGFARGAAQDALMKANGSYEGAVDILMGGS